MQVYAPSFSSRSLPVSNRQSASVSVRHAEPSVRFSGKSGSGFSLLGGLGLVGAIGAAVFAFAQYNNQQPHRLESQLTRLSEDLPKSMRNGLLFDAASKGIRHWGYRAVTGNTASDQRQVRDEYRIARNLQNRGEELVFDSMDAVARETGNAEVTQAVHRSVLASKGTQQEYHQAIERLLAFQEQTPATTRLGRAWQELNRSRVERAAQELDTAEREVMMSFMRRLQETSGSPAERVQQWRSVSVDFANRIVGKYEPERLNATLEAVHKLFDDVAAQRTVVDQERAARNAVLLYGTGGLGAFGLLCLLAASMAGRREEN